MSRGFLIALLCAVALPLAAQRAQQGAAEQHSHDQTGAAATEQAAPAPGMQGMHEHMQLMREQMARIHAAQGTEERQQLMHEHMQSMQQHMAMMGRMVASPAEGAPVATRCSQGDMPCRMGELQAQHGMMQQRMQDMQQLMEQMMQHLSERAADDERAARRR
jgi:hypothetical protein